MYRGTTPTIKFHINSDIVLSDMSQIWATFKSQTREVTKTLSDVEIDEEARTVSVTLTQEETLMFSNTDVSCQVRFLTKDGYAYASGIKELKINNVLKDGVIHAESDWY